MGVVSRAPHDPDSCTSGGASECEKLYRGVAIEGGDGNDTVLRFNVSTWLSND